MRQELKPVGLLVDSTMSLTGVPPFTWYCATYVLTKATRLNHILM